MNNPSYIFTADWFSINIPIWNELLKNYKNNYTQVLEIGSFQGLSAVWLLENILTHQDSFIRCMDTFEGSEGYTDENIKNMFKLFKHNTKRFGNKVIVYRGKSSDMLRSMKSYPSHDIIYIDGDHHAAAVLEDAILAFPLLKKDGIMIFNDYELLPSNDLSILDKPKQGIDAFVSTYADKLAIIHRGYQLVIKKLI